MAKKPTKSERAMYAEFMEAFPWCWTCGITSNGVGMRGAIGIGAAPCPGYPRHLENSHILRGPARRHDRRALTRQCKLCHDLSGGATVRVNREPLPVITLENLLWAKERFDPEFYDPDYLSSIGVKKHVPDPVPPANVYLECLTARGRLLAEPPLVIPPPITAGIRKV